MNLYSINLLFNRLFSIYSIFPDIKQVILTTLINKLYISF